MKLSFQTFCLIFVVTILHLVVITAFAPLTKSATDYFANLDVETILENGREDIAAMQDRGEMPEEESIIEAPESLLEESGNSEEQMAVALLRAKDEADVQNEDDPEEIVEPAVAIAEPVRGAVTDIRVLSERVERPEILQTVDRRQAGNSNISAPGLRGEPIAARAKERVDPAPETPEPSAPRVPRLQVREIRPL